MDKFEQFDLIPKNKDKLYFRKVGHAIKFKIREKLN